MDDGCLGADACLDAVKPHYDEAPRRREGRRRRTRPEELGPGQRLQGDRQGRRPVRRRRRRRGAALLDRDGAGHPHRRAAGRGRRSSASTAGAHPRRRRHDARARRGPDDRFAGAPSWARARSRMRAARPRPTGCPPHVDFEGEYRVDWTNSLSEGLEQPIIHSTFGYAAQLVIMDRDSGAIERVVAAHDVGRAVNPTLCEGQIEGAVHMGLGYALTEDFPADADGRPTNMTLRSLGITPGQGHARDRRDPRRVAAAERALRDQGRRRDRSRPHRRRGRRRAPRARRRLARRAADAAA